MSFDMIYIESIIHMYKYVGTIFASKSISCKYGNECTYDGYILIVI